MFWMRAYHPLLGKVGGGWVLEISSFLGPKWHSPIGSMPFHKAQPPIPLALVKHVHGTRWNNVFISFYVNTTPIYRLREKNIF